MSDIQWLTPREMPAYRRRLMASQERRFSSVDGQAAAAWPHPRRVIIDGAEFIENLNWWDAGGWHATWHFARRPSTAMGRFVQHYSEGVESGFPFWPVVRAAAWWTFAERVLDPIRRLLP